MSPAQLIMHGCEFPYETFCEPAPQTTWQRRAAQGILADLLDRRGIKHELELVDDKETREEIVESIAAVIEEAHKQHTFRIPPPPPSYDHPH